MNNLHGKVLYIDIETSPNLATVWRAGYDQNVSSESICLERQVISIQYKVSGKNKVEVLTWTMPSSEEIKNIVKFVKGCKSIPSYNKKAAEFNLLAAAHSDKDILEKFSDILNSYPVVVAQNGDAFDIKWLKGRLLYHGLSPVSNLISVDTLKLSRKNFNLNSHSLDYKSKYLFGEGKIPTKYDMWLKVMAGDGKVLKELCFEYGSKDVVLLEKLFERMLPHCDSLPLTVRKMLFSIEKNPTHCQLCDSILLKNGTREVISKAKGSIPGVYQRYICSNKACRHPFTGTIALSKLRK